MKDSQLKLFLGRILGETYRTQEHLHLAVPVSKQSIYGLINGVEGAIDEVMAEDSLISVQQQVALKEVLTCHFGESGMFAAFSDYEEIREKVEKIGLSHAKAIILLTYWLKGQKGDVIPKKAVPNRSLRKRSLRLVPVGTGIL